MLTRTGTPQGQSFRQLHRTLNPHEAIPPRLSMLEQVQACCRDAQRLHRNPETGREPEAEPDDSADDLE
jgi:hypothetical protein